MTGEKDNTEGVSTSSPLPVYIKSATLHISLAQEDISTVVGNIEKAKMGNEIHPLAKVMDGLKIAAARLQEVEEFLEKHVLPLEKP